MRGLAALSMGIGLAIVFGASCTIMNDRHLPVDAAKRSRDASRDGAPGDDDDDDATSDGDGGVIPGPPPAGCDPLTPFITDTDAPFVHVNTGEDESFPRLTEDEKTLYFTRESSTGGSTLFVATRQRLDVPFDAPKRVFAEDNVCCGAPSPDGRRLYYARFTDDGSDDGVYSVVVADRAADGSFVNTRVLFEGTSAVNYTTPFPIVDPGGPRLYMSRLDKAANDTNILSVALDGATGLPVGTPASLTNLNTIGIDLEPVPSADGLALYYYSDVDKEQQGEVFVSRRAGVGSPFATPSHVPEIKRPPDGWVSPGHMSKDGCRLYLSLAARQTDPAELRVALRAPVATR